MVNYGNGKVYKIWSPSTEQIYIGSTTQRLSKRLSSHLNQYKRCKDGIGNYVSSFEILKYDDYKIELIKECPCENKEQLHKLEGEYIREHKDACVNRLVAGRTKKQYKQDNKEQLSNEKKSILFNSNNSNTYYFIFYKTGINK